jgi:hypothetical protein
MLKLVGGLKVESISLQRAVPWAVFDPYRRRPRGVAAAVRLRSFPNKPGWLMNPLGEP